MFLAGGQVCGCVGVWGCVCVLTEIILCKNVLINRVGPTHPNTDKLGTKKYIGSAKHNIQSSFNLKTFKK